MWYFSRKPLYQGLRKYKIGKCAVFLGYILDLCFYINIRKQLNGKFGRWHVIHLELDILFVKLSGNLLAIEKSDFGKTSTVFVDVIGV